MIVVFNLLQESENAMENPNAGKKVQIKSRSEKIIEQATHTAKTAVLSPKPKPKTPPKKKGLAPLLKDAPAVKLSKSELARKQKNQKATIIYFDFDIIERLQTLRQSEGIIISRYVNGLVRKGLGI